MSGAQTADGAAGRPRDDLPRVAMTGAGGFLGRAAAEAFRAAGYEVVPVVRDPVAAHGISAFADGTSLATSLSGIEALVLIGAADTRGDDAAAVDLLVSGNVLLPGRLMAAAWQAGCPRVVLIGTAWQEVSGEGYEPFDLYAASKEAAATLAAHHARLGMRVVQLVMFDTYGPRDVRRKIVNLLLDAAASGAPLDMSPGEQHLHLVHVDDAAAAVLAAATASLPDPGGRVSRFRVDSDRSVSLREVVDILVARGAHLRVTFGARPYRVGEIMRPRSRYPRLPGWRPQHTLEEGLAECLAARMEALT